MIIKKFEEQTEIYAKKDAVITEEKKLTYEELNRYANRVARAILEYDSVAAAKENKGIVGLLFEHGIEMIIGVMGTLKAGKIYVPLDITYPENRLTYMLADSEAHLLLTDNDNLPLAERLAGKVNGDLKIINIQSPGVDGNGGAENVRVNPPGDKLAYILYTSGSTGRPRGVLQTHENVCYYTRNWTRRFSISCSDRMTLFSAFSHDGAVQDMFGALLNGAALYPYNILRLKDLARLSNWLTREKITIWHSVPTLYRYFVSAIKNNDMHNGQFPDLRFILLGGEPIRDHDIKMFTQFFPGSTLANVYGQTESSLNSIWLVNPGEPVNKMLIGEPLDKTGIFLINEDGEIVEDLGVGEIIVACKHLAPGYWKGENHRNSKGRFLQDPDLGPLYRTGDFGRLLADGNIEFMGRKDYQVKIRGFRVEVGEIESVLLEHEKIKEAAVTAHLDDLGENYLCAYIVETVAAAGTTVDETANGMELKEYLARYLPGYMIPFRFVYLDRLPLTASGKIDRNALPKPVPAVERNDTSTYIPPRDKVEEKLAEIWGKVLGIETGSIGIDENFFALGGNSLRAILMASRIRKEFNLRIPVADIFNSPTIRGLSGCLPAAGKEVFAVITLAEEKEFYELSFNQKRLWMIHQLQEGGISYNMNYRVKLPHQVDVSAIKKTLLTMIQRHESLRTSFKEVNHQPRQFIAKPGSVDIPLKVIDISSLEIKEKQEKKEIIYRDVVKAPFNLSRAPLFRAVLIRWENLSCDFVFSLHHIVTDGWSMDILEKEFTVFYEGYRTGREQKQGPLPTRYKDFAQWHNRQISDERLTGKSFAFWEKKFEEGFPLLKLPADCNPGADERQGAGYLGSLAKEIAINTGKAAEEHNTTVFTVMFALYLLWLHRFSGQQEIVCSIINAGREYEELYGIVGFFVNAVLFKTRVDPRETFFDFLDRVHKEVLDVFQHQAYPPELVFKAHHTRYPDIPVSFNMFNIVNREESEQPGVYRPGHVPEAGEVKYDIEPYIKEYKEHMDIYWVYKKAIFTPAAIEYMAGEYTKLAHFFTINSDKSYDDYKNSDQKRRFKRN